MAVVFAQLYVHSILFAQIQMYNYHHLHAYF